jgi:hypothetical protein
VDGTGINVHPGLLTERLDDASQHVPLRGEQRLHPVDYRAHAGGAAQITADDDPGLDFGDRWRQPLEQRMAVADIARQHASAGTDADCFQCISIDEARSAPACPSLPPAGAREASSRRFASKAPRFGLKRLLITTHQDNLPSRRVIEATGGVLAGLVPYPSQPGKFRLQFWLHTPTRRAGRRNSRWR